MVKHFQFNWDQNYTFIDVFTKISAELLSRQMVVAKSFSELIIECRKLEIICWSLNDLLYEQSFETFESMTILILD